MRFVLVHGGFHGAWCWDRVIPELKKLGHEAIAIDMPGAGARADEYQAGIADRAQAVAEALEPGDVLVGHSGGGYDITVGANLATDKVAHLIYLAAGLPIEGRSVIEATGGATEVDPETGERKATQLMDDDTGMLRFIRPMEGRMAWTSLEGAREFFYHDCDDATVQWAFDRLTPAPTAFPLQPVHVPDFWKAALPRSYILCLQDRSKPRWMSDDVIARLGVEPLTIDASHSPFLSKPAELAALFVKAVGTRPVGDLRAG